MLLRSPSDPVVERMRPVFQTFNRSWAACIKRIHEGDPLECPKCKAQMRVIAFIQDALVISDIIKTQRNADFRAPPLSQRSSTPPRLSTSSPCTTRSSRHLMISKPRFLDDGMGCVLMDDYFPECSSPTSLSSEAWSTDRERPTAHFHPNLITLPGSLFVHLILIPYLRKINLASYP